ncbi:MAG: DUF4359 domain-containing protein [Prevotella sp.]|nr:DUF4359 domain-containing protein [Prevotella sp.]
MKKLLFLIVVLAIAILMALTVPDKTAHKTAMMKAVKEYIDEEAASMGMADNGFSRMAKNVVGKTIEGVLGSKLKVDNYYLFNTTHVKMGDNSKLLSVGVFGHVFTFNKKMLREALEESKQAKKVEKELRKQDKAQQRLLKKEAREQRRQAKKDAREQRRRERSVRN